MRFWFALVLLLIVLLFYPEVIRGSPATAYAVHSKMLMSSTPAQATAIAVSVRVLRPYLIDGASFVLAARSPSGIVTGFIPQAGVTAPRKVVAVCARSGPGSIESIKNNIIDRHDPALGTGTYIRQWKRPRDLVR